MDVKIRRLFASFAVNSKPYLNMFADSCVWKAIEPHYAVRDLCNELAASEIPNRRTQFQPRWAGNLAQT